MRLIFLRVFVRRRFTCIYLENSGKEFFVSRSKSQVPRIRRSSGNRYHLRNVQRLGHRFQRIQAVLRESRRSHRNSTHRIGRKDESIQYHQIGRSSSNRNLRATRGRNQMEEGVHVGILQRS